MSNDSNRPATPDAEISEQNQANPFASPRADLDRPKYRPDESLEGGERFIYRTMMVMLVVAGAFVLSAIGIWGLIALYDSVFGDI